jgi:hypothetical protein
LTKHIAELQRRRAGVSECIGCGCLSLDRSQLTNPGTVRAVAVMTRATGGRCAALDSRRCGRNSQHLAFGRKYNSGPPQGGCCVR